MNKRLSEIIKYKTGGRQVDFAKLLGWHPSYLAKLLRGDNFGLQPVLTILETLPEINARWFLFGHGDMLEIGKLYLLQREVFSHAQAILEMERYIPVMLPEEIRLFEQAITDGKLPDFDSETLADLEQRLITRNMQLKNRFGQAQSQARELCKQKTVKKS